MNDASNFPENEQPEAENTSAQADAENTTAQGRVCPQCGAALEPGASFCTSCGAKIDASEDMTYHIVRPEAEHSYEDANFHPSDDAGSTPPRYYTPNDDAWAEKPKHKHHPRKPKTVRTPEQKRLITRIACLCLVCALLGGLGGGAVAGLIPRSGRAGGLWSSFHRKRPHKFSKQVSWLAARHVLRLLTCETCNGDLQHAPRLQ